MAQRVSAAEIELKDKNFSVSAGRYMEFFEDKSASLTIDQVSSGSSSCKFFNVDRDYPSFGYSDSAIWARFTLKNQESYNFYYLLNILSPHLDSIKIYLKDESGKFREVRSTGDKVPFLSRDFFYRNFVFRFFIDPLTDQTIYIRIQSRSFIDYSLVISSSDSFIKNISIESILFGIYFGALIVVLLYNLFIFFSIRDKSYLYYVIYCLNIFVLQVSFLGLGFQFLWPSSVWFTNYGFLMFIFITLCFAIQFGRRFMHLREYAIPVNRLLKYVQVVAVCLIPFVFFVDVKYIIFSSAVLTVFSAILLLFGAVQSLRMGYRPSVFYIIASGALWTGVIFVTLRFFSIMPVNMFTIFIFPAASFAEMILISFGLADRINYMKKEILSLNINLENMVTSRTEKLNSVINELEKKDRVIQLELDLAADIQRGIIPQTPFFHEGVRLVAYNSSMGKIGGDFYDIFRMQGGYLGVLIADASGHGMPAAFITAMAKISFSESTQRSLFPADIFRHVNRQLIETIKTDDFVTSFLLVIGPNHEVFFCNASHNKPFVYKRKTDQIERWDTKGLFLGALLEANDLYEDGIDVLTFGDRFYLFTDGIVESRNIDNEAFGDKRLKEIICATVDKPIDEVKNLIIGELKSFTRGTPQIDDITLVIGEIDPRFRDLEVFRERAFQLLSEMKIDESIELLKSALDIDPNDEQSHLFIGECYLKNREYKSALEHLQKYLESNEVDANVWLRIAQAHFNMESYLLARKTSQKAAQLRGNFVEALMICAKSNIKLDEFDEAIKILQNILAIDPENKTALHELDQLNKNRE